MQQPWKILVNELYSPTNYHRITTTKIYNDTVYISFMWYCTSALIMDGIIMGAESGNCPTFSQECRLHVPINLGFVVQSDGKFTWSLIGQGGCCTRLPVISILTPESWVIIYLFKHITETGIWLWNICLQLQWRHNERDGVSNHQLHDFYSTVYSDADQRKHQSAASLAFVRGIHRWPVTRKNVSIWWRHHAVLWISPTISTGEISLRKPWHLLHYVCN